MLDVSCKVLLNYAEDKTDIIAIKVPSWYEVKRLVYVSFLVVSDESMDHWLLELEGSLVKQRSPLVMQKKNLLNKGSGGSQ